MSKNLAPLASPEVSARVRSAVLALFGKNNRHKPLFAAQLPDLRTFVMEKVDGRVSQPFRTDEIAAIRAVIPLPDGFLKGCADMFGNPVGETGYLHPAKGSPQGATCATSLLVPRLCRSGCANTAPRLRAALKSWPGRESPMELLALATGAQSSALAVLAGTHPLGLIDLARLLDLLHRYDVAMPSIASILGVPENDWRLPPALLVPLDYTPRGLNHEPSQLAMVSGGYHHSSDV